MFTSYSKLAKVSNQCLILSSLDYKVVNIILFNIINILKVTLLLNNYNKQESPMSKSAMVTQINLQPCKGNHSTTRHM
jgi:hypothetical protein